MSPSATKTAQPDIVLLANANGELKEVTSLSDAIEPLPPVGGNSRALQQSLNRLKRSLPVCRHRLDGASHHQPVHRPIAQGDAHQIARLQMQVRISPIGEDTALATGLQPNVDRLSVS